MMTTTGSPRTKKTRKPRKTAAVKKLPSNPFMNEILELVSQQKTAAKKVALRDFPPKATTELEKLNNTDDIAAYIPDELK